MNLLENTREGLRSIRANLLRTVLTSLIIAVGISSLVGILTAIDGIQSSMDNSFAGLGANTFDINQGEQMGIRIGGRRQKVFGAILYREAQEYKERFGFGATVSLATMVTGAAQVKFESKKSNPNVTVMGIDENFFAVKSFKLQEGRNLTANDVSMSTNVAIMGAEIATNLFGTSQPIGKDITVLGTKFRVVGLLERKGNLTGGGDDRRIYIPIETARQLAGTRVLSFAITTSVPGLNRIELLMGEARGLMRQIRRDPTTQEDSFQVERADAVAENFKEASSKLKYGGFGIGIITLLGASIALMNIMLVSVTERTQEIGIRKALGATPSRIRQQFLIEAIVICVLGGVAGLILAMVFGNVVSQLLSQGTASFIIPWLWLGIGISVCIVVGLFSGFYPAWKASRLDPIDALRYE
ncbi:ABC transporter [Siphonobacter sp. SORGH_AS_0500]|uniref:ABC transporter permease n=1 Tax=Siphonobacter sp. SORGH_AS_0500 TaxID=1864824 RepID=UPI000CBDB434|nr:ABC transporter permease [Siphonobacter sp. SORGH_AS_0500]PKK38510.1 ABC transporter [Siphonobacter sp. SORGH_AS_0500]